MEGLASERSLDSSSTDSYQNLLPLCSVFPLIRGKMDMLESTEVLFWLVKFYKMEEARSLSESEVGRRARRFKSF